MKVFVTEERKSIVEFQIANATFVFCVYVCANGSKERKKYQELDKNKFKINEGLNNLKRESVCLFFLFRRRETRQQPTTTTTQHDL